MGTTASDSCCFTIKGISKIINIQYKSYLPLLSMLNHVKLTKGKFQSHKITASFCQRHVHAFWMILFNWRIIKWVPSSFYWHNYFFYYQYILQNWHSMNCIKSRNWACFLQTLIKTNTSYQETKINHRNFFKRDHLSVLLSCLL